jgi:lipopolysaccharide biosynthesis glycosyltransferase
MKLFLATNSMTVQSPKRLLLEASVKSAVQNTDFDIYVIFDGKKSELRLPSRAKVIEHRHRCYETFSKSGRTAREGSLRVSSGAFLRTEIPYLMNQMGFDDQFCLYTDYDVLFCEGDYSELDRVEPEYFAAAPESDLSNWSYLNTGAMLMNVESLLKDDSKIVEYINGNFDGLRIWDQTLYNDLYKDKIDRLPLEFNWKTYWGINPAAKIVHFHGAKPRSVEPAGRYGLPEIQKLRERNIEGYEFYNSAFEEISRIEVG